MRKTISSILICIIVFSFIPGALSIDTSNSYTKTTDEMNYSHTVFVELGSSTACKYCKNAHAALKNIYVNQRLPSYSVSLLTDNPLASQRLSNDYNYNGLPSVFFDGGYRVNRGASDALSAQNAYNTSITECGNRIVPNLLLTVSVQWIGNATMNITASVYHNETSNYTGHIRVYITEKASSKWHDTAGYPYTFAFLDFAINEDIYIDPSSTYLKSSLWNGNDHNFEFITCNNIMVIAAVFNSTWHQGYANPPSSNPFDAYYVDEASSASPIVPSTPPNTPDIHGPRCCKVGQEYTYTAVSTDPDEDDMYYWFDWGDGTSSGWVGPYDSGTTASANHTWTIKGLYNIKVKAKDTYDVGSDLSKPLRIIMPKNLVINTQMIRFLEQHPLLILLLQKFFGL